MHDFSLDNTINGQTPTRPPPLGCRYVRLIFVLSKNDIWPPMASRLGTFLSPS
ncbi:hypothetical protein CY34DRAFT_807918 [Suillus luteus UH-Slu-Lm8-n1]|uniref:Uncharacterized protein n=1 Tax=Suillus luteus UH-Slu-Lm8-n1 TaxID=930992 RepID=A0A0D0ADF6_9AGAM|nr:hypothetical protein CY34DRAFT_807918 [Suillus luteus UH-Slu-Lm8-n1]